MDTEHPAIFDSRGRFVPLSDAVLTGMPPDKQDSYRQVADAYSTMMQVEESCLAVERELRDTVAQARDLESLAAELSPRVDRISLVREMIAQRHR